jgi:hypothetical protein
MYFARTYARHPDFAAINVATNQAGSKRATRQIAVKGIKTKPEAPASPSTKRGASSNSEIRCGEAPTRPDKHVKETSDKFSSGKLQYADALDYFEATLHNSFQSLPRLARRGENRDNLTRLARFLP